MTFFKLMGSFYEDSNPTNEEIQEHFSEVPVFNSLVTKNNVQAFAELSTLKIPEVPMYKHLKPGATKTYNKNPWTQLAVNSVLSCVAREYFCSLEDAKIVMELEPEHEITELLMYRSETDHVLQDSLALLGLDK